MVRRRFTTTTVVLEARSASPASIIAAQVIAQAVRDARHGRPDARAWLLDVESLEPWALLLRVDARRLVALAQASLGA